MRSRFAQRPAKLAWTLHLSWAALAVGAATTGVTHPRIHPLARYRNGGTGRADHGMVNSGTER